jgi:hypothetical protein
MSIFIKKIDTIFIRVLSNFYKVCIHHKENTNIIIGFIFSNQFHFFSKINVEKNHNYFSTQTIYLSYKLFST